jgi:cytochrome P450
MQDLEFRGYEIPAGTRVVYSIYLTHRQPEYWPDPERFDPERFTVEQSRARPPFTYIPFGGGPRNCLGAAFAHLEAKVILARMLQQFEWRLVGDVHPHMGATLEPRPGVRVIVSRRDS